MTEPKRETLTPEQQQKERDAIAWRQRKWNEYLMQVTKLHRGRRNVRADHAAREQLQQATKSLLPSARDEFLRGLARRLGDAPSDEALQLAISDQLSVNRIPHFFATAHPKEFPDEQQTPVLSRHDRDQRGRRTRPQQYNQRWNYGSGANPDEGQ
jgi:hypothetical protein